MATIHDVAAHITASYRNPISTMKLCKIVFLAEAQFRLSEDTNVITVSHVGVVQDSFPTRVEVSISSGSSTAELVSA